MLVIVLFVNEFYLIVVMNTGSQIGKMLALSIGGLMCSWDIAGGWPLIFYSGGKY